MPTIFSHAIAASALGFAGCTGPGLRRALRQQGSRFWLWTAVCAMLPDADVIGFAFGIRYGDLLGHRGLSHSLLFAAIIGVMVGRMCGGRVATCMYFAAITASHGIFDALTDGGLGIAFFSPFDTERYFFPWRPIQVSPIGAGFFSARGMRVLGSELRWIWMPSAALVLLSWIRLKTRRT
jgi:inner membrane protein